MNCRGANGPQGNDCHTHSSGAWNLACKSSLARPEDCQAGNGNREIVSQRVMGPDTRTPQQSNCTESSFNLWEKTVFISTVTVKSHALNSTNLVALSMDLATKLIHSKLPFQEETDLVKILTRSG